VSRAKLEAVAVRHGLEAAAAAKLSALVTTLTGEPHAPTTVTEPAAVIDDHISDSLVALELEIVREARTILDLGAGAGFPGLPLAAALPAARVTLLESSGRKCRFIDSIAGASGIDNASAVHARAEAWPEGLEGHELVTARAVAPLPVVAEYAAPLLSLGGALVVWRGRRDQAEEAAAAHAAGELGLELLDPLPVRPYPDARHRHLQTLVKRAPTPSRFPRRAGLARKRPLGSGGGRPSLAGRPSDRKQR
jgi:16S rRNA (guanine527-N7)-methyltransferase